MLFRSRLHEMCQRVITATTTVKTHCYKEKCTDAHLTSFETYPRLIFPLSGGRGGRNTCFGIHGCESAVYDVRNALR